MTTKNYSLPFKDKQNNFTDDNGQYKNLNLNLNHQCSGAISVQSKSITNYNKKIPSNGNNSCNPFYKNFSTTMSFLEFKRPKESK